MSKKQTGWLKKYTKTEYLPDLVKHRHLFLGDPKDWDDENDAEVIKMHPNSLNFSIRSTCLTSAPDRFHFWDIFGGRRDGICLWFDRELLETDIAKDKSLIAKDVQYRTTNKLKHLRADEIPFCKREQYRDESEFRVLRVRESQLGSAEHFTFSSLSLKRIYLNSWLGPEAVKQETARIKELIEPGLTHVKVMQNRMLRKQGWIDAARAVTLS